MNAHPSKFIEPNVFYLLHLCLPKSSITALCYDHLNIRYRINTNKISVKCEIKILWWAAFVKYEIKKMPR